MIFTKVYGPATFVDHVTDESVRIDEGLVLVEAEAAVDVAHGFERIYNVCLLGQKRFRCRELNAFKRHRLSPLEVLAWATESE